MSRGTLHGALHIHGALNMVAQERGEAGLVERAGREFEDGLGGLALRRSQVQPIAF